MATGAQNGGETSQTLDRGLTVLKLLAQHEEGLTAAEIAERLGTARAVAYRLLRTLEAHNLVNRVNTTYVLGFGIAELAGQLKPRLQSTVLPILRKLSERTRNTALLSVVDGDQALILLSVEPPRSTFHLALRGGARHPLTIGADGVAILSTRPPGPSDTDEVRLARSRGYAVSLGSIQPGAVGVAAPIRVPGWSNASLGVVQLGIALDETLVPAVLDAAAEAADRLTGSGVTGAPDQRVPDEVTAG